MTLSSQNDLHTFFYPESVAVIGASQDPSKAGHQVIKNLIRAYKGAIYPVNPRGGELLGLTCYKSLGEIEGKIDLAMITVPAVVVPGVFDEIVARGDIKSVVVVSAGFSETKTEAGKEREDYIIGLAKEHGIRFFGPNCTGVINTGIQMDTTIEPSVELKPGHVSVFSQSGAVAGSILLMMNDQPVPMGFSKWAHVGNMADVDV
ncbi:MAG TPA: CoA-binding protein, partial [Clostridia bacterium]|nr:CoA-binding protein [Clostridia bacterium]